MLLALAIAGCGPSCGAHARTPAPTTAVAAAGDLPIPSATPGGQRLTPPARSDPAIAYDGASDQLVLFGGTGADGRPLTDTWTFDGQRWTQHGLPQAPPGGAAGQMTFDAARGQVVLVAAADQTWTWDGGRWTHEQPVHQPPRSGRLAYDPSLGVVVLLAETSALGTHTWGWNGSDWFAINEATPDPGSLEALAYDVRGGRLVGIGDGTWAFIGHRWSRLGDLPAGLPPVNMSRASSPALNAPVAFGGGTESTGLSADLWAWDGKAWQRREAPNGPTARRGAALADDQKGQQLVLFGGVGADGILGDTWTWTPDKGWTRVA